MYDFSRFDPLITEGESLFINRPHPVPVKLWTKALQMQRQKTGEPSDGVILRFRIPEPETYPEFLETGDPAALNSAFGNAYSNFYDALDELVMNVPDGAAKESIESMGRQLDKLKKQYDMRARGNPEDAWRKAVEAFIDGMIPAIYTGIIAADDNTYDLILNMANAFLQQNGIFTKELKTGEKLDAAYCDFAEDSSATTKDPQLSDVIVKIRQYPYLTVYRGEEHLIKCGQAVAWRYDG
ncbi:MAG: hypothetical protein HFF84_07915 [Oscillibacter sp.]|nr:hypothetical protein [Oscillibacter sp.]